MIPTYRFTAGLLSLVLTTAIQGDIGGIASHKHSVTVSFTHYTQQHGRTYQPGSDEYHTRLALFEARAAAIEHHNRQPKRLWKAVINKLTDRTDEELAMLRGYRRDHRLANGGTNGRTPAGLMSISSRAFDFSQLPKDVDWKHRLNAMKDVHDQGECGSCWAFASATVLRAHAELYQKDRTFSVQQLISCTPNRFACGGQGGCNGATAELAMQYVSRLGLVGDDAFPYMSKDVQCPDDMQMPRPTFRTALMEKIQMSQAGKGMQFGMTGWSKLPENRVEPLMLALFEQGPVAVSLSADGNWNLYGGGIMDACERDAIVNHAVALTGYGEDQDSGAKYWSIQNSWGPNWGEDGFARVLRRDRHEENTYCGWDKRPDLGTGCKGGPPEVYVCGACGILYDSVVPSFALSKDGWWSRKGHRSVSSSEEDVILLNLNATTRAVRPSQNDRMV